MATITTSETFKHFHSPTTLSTRTITASATQTTTPDLFQSALSTPSSNSDSPNNTSPAIPIIWIVFIILFSLALIIFTLSVYKFRRRIRRFEEEVAFASKTTPQSTPKPDHGEFQPKPIRRTTSGLRDEWREWITRPPPLRSNFSRRRDSAVLFGGGPVFNSTSEPLLTAHEVEVSGVLGDRGDISPLPPPAYSPRRF